MAASPSRLRQRSGSTPHDALTVDRRSSPHQPLSQPLDRQCTHSCQAINFAPSQIANVASQHHVSSCVAVRAGKTNSQTASIHAHQVSRRGQIPIAFAAPHRTPHRDFVPWRFLVAGRISTWIAQSCRRPKTCTVSTKVRFIKICLAGKAAGVEIDLWSVWLRFRGSILPLDLERDRPVTSERR